MCHQPFAGQRGRQRSECAFAGRGIIRELEKNVRAQLSTIQSDEVTPDRRFRARVDDAIREGLKALGYYEPTIEFDLRPPPKRGRQVLIAKVTRENRCALAEPR